MAEIVTGPTVAAVTRPVVLTLATEELLVA
jgi:hypothetical protein